MRLENKVALITGGYGGMGRASARLFAKEGATVFIAGRSEERGDALAKEINDGGATAYFVELAARSPASQATSRPPTQPPSGPLRACPVLRRTSTRTGESGATSSSPGSSRQT
jgi:hypothetical protein